MGSVKIENALVEGKDHTKSTGKIDNGKLDSRAPVRVKLSVRVTERFFSGVPHPHLP
jgi:hypothetical protein